MYLAAFPDAAAYAKLAAAHQVVPVGVQSLPPSIMVQL